MSEPTSALTFEDLIIEVAYKLGMASYGAAGDEEPQIPTDTHDLIVCKRIVNKAIRMFLHDGPSPNGWNFSRPVASISVWPSISTSSSNAIATASYDIATGKTTLTVPTAAFYESMELRTITITSVGDKTITDYVSSTSIKVSGDLHLTALNKTWSMVSNGNYTLPNSFSGEYIGELSYAAGTNRGTIPRWVDESVIRKVRADIAINSGTPALVAVRIMNSGTPRRRWEMITDRVADSVLVLEFPYILSFDDMVNLTDTHPAPFSHDETVKAACLAQAEKDVEDTIQGNDMQYYRSIALPNSYRVDALSTPKRLGYCGNPIRTRHGLLTPTSLRYFTPRPTVSFNQ